MWSSNQLRQIFVMLYTSKSQGRKGRSNLSLILLCCYHTVFQSVSTVPDTDPLTITEHQVELVANELDFLWTKVNDLILHCEKIKAFIESFRFPMIVGQLPVTLLRKIISQHVVSCCRALLSLQPIKQTDAEMLVSTIIHHCDSPCLTPWIRVSFHCTN